MVTICPKCDYKRDKRDDPNVPDYQCPSCGIVYVKYVARQEAESSRNRSIDLGGDIYSPRQTAYESSFNQSLTFSLPVFLTLLFVIAGTGWKSYNSPNTMMNDLRVAALEGSASDLNEYVDFIKLRENVRSKVVARVREEMDKASRNSYSGLAQSMALGMVDSSLKAVISPANIKEMIKKGAENSNSNSGGSIDYPFEYTSMNTVVIRIKRVNYYLERTGFFSWKLIDIDNPK